MIDSNTTDLSLRGVVMGVRPERFLERLPAYYIPSLIDNGVDSVDRVDRVLSDAPIADTGSTITLTATPSDDDDDDDLFFDNVRASSSIRWSTVQPSNRVNQRDNYKTTTSRASALVPDNMRSPTELKTDDPMDLLLKQAKLNEVSASAKKRNHRSVQHRQFMRQQTLLTDRNTKRNLKNAQTNSTVSSSSSSDIKPAVSDDEDEFFYPIFDQE